MCRDSLEEDDELALQTEVDILSQMDHPNVVKLYEIFDEDDCMYLVLELMTGGEVSPLICLTNVTFIAIRSYCREGTLFRERSCRYY